LLFDLDGTLVDAIYAHLVACQLALAGRGGGFTTQMYVL